jgi:long-chain acyl-CoA synthetase
VREYSVPPVVEDAERGNLADVIVENAVEAPGAAVLSRRVDGRWEDVTARQFLAECTSLAKGLVAAGVQPGDRVGLMSKTRYEWTLVDFSIWFAGAVTVPIYETSSAEQIAWILSDSGAVACFVETDEHAAEVAQLRDDLPALRDVWTFDQGAIEALNRSGAGVDDAEIDERRKNVGSHDLATIIYTSGTTGRPKGCELTHANFLGELRNAIHALEDVFFSPGASTLLFLPLAHVFARIIEVGCIIARARLGHSADIKNLVNDLAEFQPTFVLSVPRVFEKVYNSAEQKAESEGKGRIFRAAAGTAIAYSEAVDKGGPGIVLRAKHTVFDRLVYGKLRAALGGKVKWSVSGGAPLGARLGHFYRGIGLTIFEGYGLTETCAASTVNTPEHIRVGSVGRPLPGVGVRIADDGEVLVQGPHVFTGYFKNPTATDEAIRGGWFHTGDLGELDDDGFLRITGRKKELIVTAGGKNVAPAVLEDRLRAHRLISQCMVVGDAKPFIACLVTLDPEALPAWQEQHGKAGMSMEQLAEDPEVRAEVQAAVDDANKAVSKAEAIRKFSILPVDFTEEGGQLTPSMKLKRAVVMKEFAGAVDDLYR